MLEKRKLENPKKEKVLNLLTLDLPLFLLCFNYLLYSAFEVVFLKQVIRMAALALIIVGGFVRRVHIDKSGIVFLGISAVAVFLNGLRAFNLVFLVIFAVCAPNDIKEIFHKAFRVSIILLMILLISVLVGFNHNISSYRASGRIRNGMGFSNPNSAAIFYYSVCSLFLLSRKEIKWPHMLLVLVVSFVVHYFTSSRTTLIANLIFLMLWGMYQIPHESGKQILAKGSVLLVDILFAVNLLAVFFTDQLMPLDDLLSWRITFLKQLVETSSVKNILFGGAAFEVDNFYHIVLFQYGIFVYGFLALAVHRMMKRLAECNQYVLSGFLVSIFLIGLMEGCMIRPELILFLTIWKLIVCEESLCV